MPEVEAEFHNQVLQVDALLRQHRYEDALRHGKKLLPLGENYVPLLRTIGYAALPLQDFETAKEVFYTAKQYDKDSERALIALGDLALAEGDQVSAERFYLKASKNNRSPVKAMAKLIELTAEGNNSAKEIRLLRKALWKCSPNPKFINRWFKRLRDLQGVRKTLTFLEFYRLRHPMNQTLMLLRARFFSELGMRKKALHYLSSLESNLGGSYEWFKLMLQNIRATKIFPEGWDQERLDRELKSRYLELIENEPNIPDGYYELANGIRNSEGAGDSHPFQKTPIKTQALDFYLLAAKKAPHSIPIQIALYRMFNRTGQGLKAKSLLAKLERDHGREDHDILFEIAKLSLKERDLSQVKEILQSIFQRGIQTFQWMELAGDYCSTIGRLPESIYFYYQSVLKQPGDQQVKRSLITHLLHAGLFKDAQCYLKPFSESRGSVPWVTDLFKLIELQHSDIKKPHSQVTLHRVQSDQITPIDKLLFFTKRNLYPIHSSVSEVTPLSELHTASDWIALQYGRNDLSRNKLDGIMSRLSSCYIGAYTTTLTMNMETLEAEHEVNSVVGRKEFFQNQEFTCGTLSSHLPNNQTPFIWIPDFLIQECSGDEE